MSSDTETKKETADMDIAVAEDDGAASLPPSADTAAGVPPRAYNEGDPIVTGRPQPPHRYDQHAAPNIRDFQPEQRRPGDFERDLLPGGVDSPAGNLMGPNHPAFGGVQPPSVGGGYGMRPRFDPYGPPGGPTDPRNVDTTRTVWDPNDPRNNRQGGPRHPRPPPGGTGDPNPDHERPPNDLNNNMFM